MPYQHVRPVPVVALSPTSAAAATGLRPERINAAVRSGDIRAVRVGTKTRILVSDLERWLLSHAPASRCV
jgi:excisionase family DNA binding protein